MLDEFIHICDTNEIDYFLLGRNLFWGPHGIREFIQWDDDIDVGMLRETTTAFHNL